MNIHRTFFIIAALMGLLSVAIGAFAAHGLSAILSEKALGWIDTGVQYQMFHTLVVLVLAVWLKQSRQARLLRFAATSFVMGVVLFSGSLYTMAITNYTGLALLTPIGGVLFLIAWSLLIYVGIQSDAVEK